MGDPRGKVVCQRGYLPLLDSPANKVLAPLLDLPALFKIRISESYAAIPKQDFEKD